MSAMRENFNHYYLNHVAYIQYTYKMKVFVYDLLSFTIATLFQTACFVSKLSFWSLIAEPGNLRQSDAPKSRTHLENAGSLWGTMSPAPCSVICYQGDCFIQR